LKDKYLTFMSDFLPDINQKLNPLYFKNVRGKILVWQVGIRGDKLVRVYGTLGGKTRRVEKKIHVNLSGRSLEEQAMLEANSEYKKKYDSGYREDLKEEIRTPMLAWKYSAKKVSRWPVGVQAKLDGIRALFKLDNGEVVVRSRNNNDFSQDFPLLKGEVKKLLECLPPGIELDGELFMDNFHELCSVVRSQEYHPANENVRYLIFDMIYDDIFMNRYNILLRAFKRVKNINLDTVSLLLCFLAYSEEDIFHYFHQFRKLGYEGAIIRNLWGYYRSTRTYDLMKLKEFHDEECTIIDVISSQGNEEGLAIFLVKDPRGHVFRVRPSGSFEERRKWLQNKEQIIGKKYTVRYFERTKTGAFRFPVGIEFRDYE